MSRLLTPTAPSTADATRAPGDRVITALAVGEARRILRSWPWWLAMAAATVWAWAELRVAGHLVTARAASQLGTLASPMTVAAVILGHMAASRVARDGVAPVAEATTTDGGRRRAGVMAAMLAPALLASLWALAVLVAIGVAGGLGGFDPVESAGVGAWVLLGGLVGIAAARIGHSLIVGSLTAFGLLVAATVVTNLDTTTARLAPPGDWLELSTAVEWAPVPRGSTCGGYWACACCWLPWGSPRRSGGAPQPRSRSSACCSRCLRRSLSCRCGPRRGSRPTSRPTPIPPRSAPAGPCRGW